MASHTGDFSVGIRPAISDDMVDDPRFFAVPGDHHPCDDGLIASGHRREYVVCHDHAPGLSHHGSKSTSRDHEANSAWSSHPRNGRSWSRAMAQH